MIMMMISWKHVGGGLVAYGLKWKVVGSNLGSHSCVFRILCVTKVEINLVFYDEEIKK